MLPYKNPHSNPLRRLLQNNRAAVEFSLLVWEEFHSWPTYGAVGHRYSLSRSAARTLVEIAKLSVTHPVLFAEVMALPPPSPVHVRNKTGRKRTKRDPSMPRTPRFSHTGIEVSPEFLVAEKLVYFVLDPAQNAVKIGYAKKGALVQRLKDIQTGNVAVLKLLATIPGSRKKEASLHRQFHTLRQRGEWFRYEEPLVSFIEELCTKIPD